MDCDHKGPCVRPDARVVLGELLREDEKLVDLAQRQWILAARCTPRAVRVRVEAQRVAVAGREHHVEIVVVVDFKRDELGRERRRKQLHGFEGELRHVARGATSRVQRRPHPHIDPGELAGAKAIHAQVEVCAHHEGRIIGPSAVDHGAADGEGIGREDLEERIDALEHHSVRRVRIAAGGESSADITAAAVARAVEGQAELPLLPQESLAGGEIDERGCHRGLAKGPTQREHHVRRARRRVARGRAHGRAPVSERRLGTERGVVEVERGIVRVVHRHGEERAVRRPFSRVVGAEARIGAVGADPADNLVHVCDTARDRVAAAIGRPVPHEDDRVAVTPDIVGVVVIVSACRQQHRWRDHDAKVAREARGRRGGGEQTL